jgi:uncharacterized protein (DUF488 family)
VARSPKTHAQPIFTIGHSTHPIEGFLALLNQHQIAILADVRSFPSSRRWPQFNQAELERSVTNAGIEYLWFKQLGGRRHGVTPDSPHTAWEHPAFRSYADYADGADFAEGIERLTGLAECRRTAYMCSEGLWWRCHRRIISDHLLLLRWAVMHIMPDGKLVEHALPQFARVVDDRLIYDGPPKESK